MIRLTAAWWIAVAAAGAADNALLRGGFHFVELRIAGVGAAEAINAGGTLTFDGAGSYQVRGRIGKGKEAAKELSGAGKYDAAAEPGAILLDDPALRGSRVRLRFTSGAGVLMGPAGSGESYGLLVAVRAPAAPVNAALLNGIYAGGYMALHGAAPEGLATAFVELTANGGGAIAKSLVIAHAASIDDVNREEVRTGSTYKLGENGAGSARFEGPSDALSGDREIFASADGEVLLGISTAAETRDILVAVRKPAEAASFQFQGAFWISELLAENEFAFRPKTARFGAADGVVVGRGEGTALLSQITRMGGKSVHLTTANRYQLSTTGSMEPTGKVGINNFALNVGAGVFAGAHVGAKGDLSLGHGILVGLRIPPPESPSGVMLAAVANRSAPDLPVVAISPGALLSLSGSGLAGQDAKAVSVTINGSVAPHAVVSPGRIDVTAPESLQPGVAAVQVIHGGKASNALNVAVLASSPSVVAAAHADGVAVSAEKPAVTGQPVSIRVAGLGPKADAVQVLFDGAAGKVQSVVQAADAPGVHVVSAVIPAEIAGRVPAKVAIVTPDAVSDIAELLVTRSK